MNNREISETALAIIGPFGYTLLFKKEAQCSTCSGDGDICSALPSLIERGVPVIDIRRVSRAGRCFCLGGPMAGVVGSHRPPDLEFIGEGYGGFNAMPLELYSALWVALGAQIHNITPGDFQTAYSALSTKARKAFDVCSEWMKESA